MKGRKWLIVLAVLVGLGIAGWMGWKYFTPKETKKEVAKKLMPEISVGRIKHFGH
jgi:hypothetical protein